MIHFNKILFLRLCLPILLPILAFGTILHFFVLDTLDDFAKEEIQNDLEFNSRRVYAICNFNFNDLLLSGMADDPDELTITRALTLGQVEDFFIEENLQGYIYDQSENRVILKTRLPETINNRLHKLPESNVSELLSTDQDKFYISLNNFQPWNWQILILKNANVYAYLIAKVNRLQLFTLTSLIGIAVMMIFFIYRSIHKPTREIISRIENQKKPNYQGIDVFEFLSDTISGMMESIRQSEEKYRMLVENSNHIIWETDLEFKFTFISPTIETLLGYQPDDLIGKTPFDFMDENDAARHKTFAQHTIQNRSIFDNYINTLFHKEGYPVIFETAGAPIFNNTNECYGYRGINRNITDRVQAEKEKIEAQMIAADQAQHALVGQVAGKMAHDFNNILSIIMGNAELALCDANDPETENVLQIIFDQTKRGKNLTKNLVAFAKDQEPKQEFFNINSIILLVLSLLKKDIGEIQIQNNFNDNLPDLLADPGMIEHSLVNLLQNSIHALSLSSDPVICLTTWCNNNYIYIEIKDNGCGIPNEHLEQIFTPSFTLKGSKDVTQSYQKGIKGTGYGMSNIKKYIRQHKGDVFVDSEFGKYTSVTLKLPVIEKELTNQEKQFMAHTITHTHKKILLVEDEATIAQVQSRVLSQKPCCHSVAIAENGKEAINLFDRNNYDLISLDYILPGLLNGMDIYNHIRENNRQIPILFISGNIEFLESIKDLKKNDASIDHLSKPCQNTDYLNAVNRLLSIPDT